MKNDWAGHPTFDYATFTTYKVNVFGHICVVEEYQDGDIWSDNEYWGSRLWDFDGNRYLTVSGYEYGGDDYENIINRWQKHGDPWDNTIDEHIEMCPDDIDALNFYKAWIKSDVYDASEFYKKYYNKENDNSPRV